MNTNTNQRKKTSSNSENREKGTATINRRSDSTLLGRRSPRNQSPLASPSSSPTLSQSQSPPPFAGSPTLGKFFPEVHEENAKEVIGIDVTGKEDAKDNDGSNSNSETGNDSSSTESNKPRRSLKSCPCGKSSGGKSWLLNCISCSQTWHNTCANIKGEFPKSVIGSLDNWLCPWCFVCPYEPPKGHKSGKQSTSLATAVISDSIVTQIEDAMKLCITSQNDELVKSIQNSLNTLAGEVKSFQVQVKTQSPTLSPDHCTNQPIESITEDVTTESGPEQPFLDYKPEFVTEEYAAELRQFLDQEAFIPEGKRSVASYGEKYKYMGSKSQGTKPIPEVFKPLLDKLNGDLGYELNQVLVNRYSGPDALLPKHSDNEYDINPESDIFTLSIGDSATVKFSSTFTSDKSELPVENRSLYSMKRSSQNFYTHQIDANPNNSVRYSITIRSIHWTFLNSLHAIGDSNFGKIQFGEGKGKVGKSTPGKRDWAATVSDIVPSNSMSYKNVVTMVGTNDLKLPNCDVMGTYKKYKGKLEQIRELNPRCNIYVCPVLPSRSHKINERIFEFNRLLFNDLVISNLKISLVRGLGDFLDRGNILRSALHDQRTNEDVLHINDQGYRILVKCIKHAIFSSKSTKGSTGRTYANASRPD